MAKIGEIQEEKKASFIKEMMESIMAQTTQNRQENNSEEVIRQLEESKQAHEEDLATERKAHEEELAKERKAHREETSSLKRDHEDDFTSAKKSHEREIARVREDHEDEVARMKKHYQHNLDDVQGSLDSLKRKYDTLQSDYQLGRDEIQQLKAAIASQSAILLTAESEINAFRMKLDVGFSLVVFVRGGL